AVGHRPPGMHPARDVHMPAQWAAPRRSYAPSRSRCWLGLSARLSAIGPRVCIPAREAHTRRPLANSQQPTPPFAHRQTAHPVPCEHETTGGNMRVLALSRRYSLLIIGVAFALAAAAILIVQGVEGSS